MGHFESIHSSVLSAKKETKPSFLAREASLFLSLIFSDYLDPLEFLTFSLPVSVSISSDPRLWNSLGKSFFLCF